MDKIQPYTVDNVDTQQTLYYGLTKDTHYGHTVDINQRQYERKVHINYRQSTCTMDTLLANTIGSMDTQQTYARETLQASTVDTL